MRYYPVNTFLIALLSITLSVAAQFSLKAGMGSAAVKDIFVQPLSFCSVMTLFTDRFVLGGFLLYGLGAVAWLGVLSKWEVSKAYPLVGLGFALTVLIGLVAGENINPLRIAGVVLICGGVFAVGHS